MSEKMATVLDKAELIAGLLNIESNEQKLRLTNTIQSMLKKGNSEEYVVGFLSLCAAKMEWLLQIEWTLLQMQMRMRYYDH